MRKKNLVPALQVPGIGEYALVMHILHSGDPSKWPTVKVLPSKIDNAYGEGALHIEEGADFMLKLRLDVDNSLHQFEPEL